MKMILPCVVHAESQVPPAVKCDSVINASCGPDIVINIRNAGEREQKQIEE